MISKTDKTAIINTYLMIVNEFFIKFLESDICSYESGSLSENYNSEEKLNYHLYTGINIIYRVFEFIFLKTSSIVTTYYYTDSAYNYYFEYIEQIYKTNLLQNFNYSDALLFVYKRTILKFYEKESTETVEIGGKQILMNIIELNSTDNRILNVSRKDFDILFSNIVKITNMLLCWNDKFDKVGLELKDVTKDNENNNEQWQDYEYNYNNRIHFCRNFLERMLKSIDKIGNIINYLPIINIRLNMTIKQWGNLLELLLTDVSKIKKKIFLDMDDFYIQFYTNDAELKNKLDSDNYKSIVNWLINGNII